MKNLTYLSRSIAMALACILFTACGLKQDLDEMHDATLRMDKATQKMSEQTAQLGDMTGWMYGDARQGIAFLSRETAMKLLVEEEAMSAKLSAAAKFLMTFEFQLWKGGQIDDQFRREALQKAAVAEFFRDTKSFVKAADGAIDPASDENAIMILNALAAASHFMNPNQEIQAALQNFELNNFYQLIRDGLELVWAVERGEIPAESLPPFAEELASWEHEAIYLMQLRHNMLAALALADITDIEDRSLAGKLWGLVVGLDADVAKVNSIHLATKTVPKLEQAIIVQRWLEDNGIEPELDAYIRDYFVYLGKGDLGNTANGEAIPKSEPGQRVWDLIVEFQELNAFPIPELPNNLGPCMPPAPALIDRLYNDEDSLRQRLGISGIPAIMPECL